MPGRAYWGPVSWSLYKERAHGISTTALYPSRENNRHWNNSDSHSLNLTVAHIHSLFKPASFIPKFRQESFFSAERSAVIFNRYQIDRGRHPSPPQGLKVLNRMEHRKALLVYIKLPKQVNMMGWKGNHIIYAVSQCSQRSGGPVGPRGGTAKSPGPDGTAECGPPPS